MSRSHSSAPAWRRLWSRVARTGECWEWTGPVNENGYGRMTIEYERWYVHRLSYELHHGTIPDGMNVCHRCDNPRCVRPEHLFLGTQADNMADMRAKGRAARRRRTHCKKGHPYTPENTRYHISGYQRCRECENAPRRKGAKAA